MISLNCSHCAVPATGAPDAFKIFCFPEYVIVKLWFVLHMQIVLVALPVAIADGFVSIAIAYCCAAFAYFYCLGLLLLPAV